MQLVRKSVLDRIASDVDGAGCAQLHWAKLTYAGAELISRENHIAMIEPSADLEELRERESASLEKMGFPWDAESGLGWAATSMLIEDLRSRAS